MKEDVKFEEGRNDHAFLCAQEVSNLSQITIWNVIGWGFLIFLAVSKSFFDEQLSLITTGLGGLICLMLSLWMINSGGEESPQHSNERHE